MAEIQIEFSGPAAMLVPFKLNDTNTFEAGKTKEIPGGAVIRFLPRREGRSFGAETVIIMILSASGTVALNLVSSYIYDKLKPHKEKIEIQINRRSVEMTEAGITRILEEEFKMKKS